MILFVYDLTNVKWYRANYLYTNRSPRYTLDFSQSRSKSKINRKLGIIQELPLTLISSIPFPPPTKTTNSHYVYTQLADIAQAQYCKAWKTKSYIKTNLINLEKKLYLSFNRNTTTTTLASDTGEVLSFLFRESQQKNHSTRTVVFLQYSSIRW